MFEFLDFNKISIILCGIILIITLIIILFLLRLWYTDSSRSILDILFRIIFLFGVVFCMFLYLLILEVKLLTEKDLYKKKKIQDEAKKWRIACISYLIVLFLGLFIYVFFVAESPPPSNASSITSPPVKAADASSITPPPSDAAAASSITPPPVNAAAKSSITSPPSDAAAKSLTTSQVKDTTTAKPVSHPDLETVTLINPFLTENKPIVVLKHKKLNVLLDDTGYGNIQVYDPLRPDNRIIFDQSDIEDVISNYFKVTPASNIQYDRNLFAVKNLCKLIATKDRLCFGFRDGCDKDTQLIYFRLPYNKPFNL